MLSHHIAHHNLLEPCYSFVISLSWPCCHSCDINSLWIWHELVINLSCVLPPRCPHSDPSISRPWEYFIKTHLFLFKQLHHVSDSLYQYMFIKMAWCLILLHKLLIPRPHWVSQFQTSEWRWDICIRYSCFVHESNHARTQITKFWYFYLNGEMFLNEKKTNTTPVLEMCINNLRNKNQTR